MAWVSCSPSPAPGSLGALDGACDEPKRLGMLLRREPTAARVRRQRPRLPRRPPTADLTTRTRRRRGRRSRTSHRTPPGRWCRPRGARLYTAPSGGRTCGLNGSKAAGPGEQRQLVSSRARWTKISMLASTKRNGVGSRGTPKAPPPATAQQVREATPPAPPSEVVERAQRRQFSAEYKQRILREADQALASGEEGGLGALLRREGLYSSHLLTWR